MHLSEAVRDARGKLLRIQTELNVRVPERCAWPSGRAASTRPELWPGSAGHGSEANGVRAMVPTSPDERSLR